MEQSVVFIAGAPKCGTSSLFYWLNDCPKVAATEPKETFFLIDEQNPLRNKEKNWLDSEASVFLSLFHGSGKIMLEGTTHLLYQSQEVLDYIKQNFPSSKFIFVLRDPIKRIESSFNYTKNNLLRVKEGFSINDYLRALRNSSTEELSNYILRENSLYVLSRDLEYGVYSNYLKNWLEVFSSEQIKLVLFEDLKSNPKKEMDEICDFLSLPKDFYENYSFKKENESISVKHKGLYRFGKRFNSLFGKKSRLKKLLKRLISHSSKKSHELIDDENKEFLIDYYSNEGNRLKELGFDLDVQKWKYNG